MSIRTQIARCIQKVTASDDQVTATLCFAKDFLGFQGHFPQDPVLPGMCLLETVLVLAQRSKGKSVRMTELIASKFYAAVLPGQTVTVDCTVKGDIIVAYVKTDAQRIAHIKMRWAYA